MKEIFSKGNISLFIICAIVTVLFGWLMSLCTPDKVNITAVSMMGGVSSALAIGAVGERLKLKLGCTDAAILGVIAGLIIILAIY